MTSIGGRWTAVAAVSIAAVGLVAIAPSAGAAPAPNSFAQTNLIANKASFHPKLVDPALKNAWGLAAGPNPLWVSDNNSGVATVYSGGIGSIPVTKDLQVPVPGGNPTGQVFNPTSAFPAIPGWPAIFIVDTDSIGNTQSPGEIAAWAGPGFSSFTVEVSPKGGPGGKTPAGAVFKGLALATTPKAGPELFAADVHNARIDVFNSAFHPLKTPAEFHDKKIPAGYAPFNIQLLGNRLYVTYGLQNRAKTDVVPGKGRGFVDVYSVNGFLIKHLVSHGALDEPWGLAMAPAGFGPFAGKLLVGNLGNGWINVYNPTTGAYLGWLKRPNGTPVAIPGLWGLMVGNNAFGGPHSLVFSAGPNSYNNGIVGVLNPAPPSGGGGW
jgi:uncharacterized protein (TIGR03118 family)